MMQSDITHVLLGNRAEFPEGARLVWARVHSTDPLTVIKFGESVATPVSSPASLAGLAQGQRAICAEQGQSLILVNPVDRDLEAVADVTKLNALTDSLTMIVNGLNSDVDELVKNKRAAAGKVNLGQWSQNVSVYTHTVSLYRFRTTPRVTVGVAHGAGGGSPLEVRAYDETTTSFKLLFFRHDGGSLNGQWLIANWIAVEEA